MDKTKLNLALPLAYHLVIVLAIGIGLNLIPAPFDSSGIVVFGCGAAVYAALRFPPVIAIPVALLISLPLWFLGGSIVGKESLTLLPVVVSLFGYRKSLKRVIKVGAFFWSLVFLPILLLEHALYEADQLSMMFSGVLVTWISGVFGLISGHFIYITGNGVKSHQTHVNEKVSLRFLFSYFFSGSFFVASMAVIYLSVSLYQTEQEKQIIRYMQQRVDVLEQQLSNFVSRHKKAISVASQSLSTPYAISRLDESGANQLSVLAAHYPEFLTFLVTNENGDITHSYPPDLINRAIGNDSLNVSYRPYFSMAMHTGAPFLSDVFQGKGFGSEPIVAISSAIIDEDGGAVGIVEGSLSLKSFASIDTLNLPGFALLLEDKKGNVIYASAELGLTPLNQAPTYDCELPCNSIMFADKQWFRVVGSLPSMGWAVSYYYDYYRLLLAMSDYLIKDLLLLLGLSVFGTFAGYIVARIIESPIRSLIRYIANFNPTNENSSVFLSERALYIQEIASLNDEFSSLERRLIKAFDALEQLRNKEKALNVELADFNLSLENKIEEKTQHLAKALDEANAASVAKTQFLANMSHEIRTPMNGIIGSCELMLESEMPATVRDRAEVISRSACNLLMILDSVLDWSKIESGKMQIHNQDVCISDLIAGCCQLYEHLAMKKAITFDVCVDDSVPNALITDGGKLSQVLNNLISNAIKFTHKGNIQIHALYCNGELAISVKDSGIGIAKDKLVDIFEQFEQADTSTTRDYGGTGLGLAISKGLIELLGGKINVYSEEQKGSEFKVCLPCRVGHIKKAVSKRKGQELPSSLKILLAEDSDINADIVMNMLASTNATCIRVKDGAQAVEAAKRYVFDVILMDCQMPVMDGLSASRLIRKLGKNNDKVVLIALTANAFTEDQQASLAAGMNAHLSKPIRKQVLFDCITNELASLQHSNN